MADTATEKPKPRTIGDIVTVKPGGIVIGPDNDSHVVIRGAFYLDRTGTFLVDGEAVTVQ